MSKKKDETKPDRPASPLPSITAPKPDRTVLPLPSITAPKPDRPASPLLPPITAPQFAKGAEPAPEVSVTSPNTAPAIEEPEERTNTETQLDPSAYAPPPDKNPEELSSDFAPISGKQLDAGGRLVAKTLAPVSAPAPELLSPRGTPAPPPARGPVAAPDVDTETAVPKHRAFRKVEEPKVEEPKVQQVTGQRREPGRWVLNREGQFASEAGSEVEPGAFDPTVRRAAPTGPPRKPRLAIAGIAVVAVLIAGAAAWMIGLGPSADPTPVAPAPASSDPEPARFRITSKPSGAAVHINGVSLGVTPVDRQSPFAPEAELEVEVTLKGYRPWTRRFHAGQSVSAHAQLKPSR